METPFANILHRATVRRLAGGPTFARGRDYFARGRVVSVGRKGGALHAVVRGDAEYRVRIWVNESGLAYSCSCPMGADGAFCKHCVAASLAWLARVEPNGPLAASGAPRDAADLRAFLVGQDAASLVEIILEQARVDARFAERLRQRAVSARPPPRTT